MKQFRVIQYGKLLFEGLRNYFSVNSNGLLSILYRYLLSCIYPMQQPIDDFSVWRTNKKLIAGCYYQIGQLTNLLNFLFDSTQNRIYITQAGAGLLFVPTLNDGNLLADMTFAPTLTDGVVLSDMTLAPTFNDTNYSFTQAIIWLPSDIYNDAAILQQITALVEQVKIQGLFYNIQQI